MRSLFGDVRLGFRHLRRSPGFAAVAIMTLALAIWANAVIFAVVDAILLKSLPFAEPSRLAIVAEAFPQLNFEAGTFSAGDFNLYRTLQKSFKAVGAAENRDYELSGGGRPQQVTGARVTGSIFAVLGVPPLLGRTFSQQDDDAGLPYVVLSHQLWVNRYGRDPAIVGKTLQLDRATYTITAVMPPSFKFPLPGPLVNSRVADVWIPAAFKPADLLITGGPFNFTVFGRLRPGTSFETAAAETAALAPRIQEKYPASFAAYSGGAKLYLRLSSYTRDVVGDVRSLLVLLTGASALVLLIACANLGALLLSRGIRRRKEMATRAALGASRLVLLRQLFVEHLVLAALGGALGATLAFTGQQAFVSLLPPGLPIPNDIEVTGRVVLFTVALTLTACLLFGIAPALLLRQKHLLTPLYETGRGGSAARGGRRLQSVLIVAELAVAIVLLIAAGLLVRSFDRLTRVDPGFRPTQLLALSVPLPSQVYTSGAQIRTLYQQALDKIRALPQLEQAGLSSDVPLQSRNTGSFALEGRRTGPNMTPPSVHYTWVLGDYVRSLGVPLVRGRWLTDADREGTAPVVLINATMAKQFWPNQDPVGQRIRWAADRTWMTIAGVVGDVRYDGLKAAPSPHVYRPFLQESDALIANPFTGGLRRMTVVVRTTSDPAAIAGQIEREVHALDPELAIADIRTLDRDVHTSIARERFTAVLVSVFAALAAFLAIVGVYSVLAFAVAQQTGDIGLRMALGAQKRDVLRLVLRTSVLLTLWAAVLGIAGAWAMSRSLQTLLFGISATDPLTFVSAPLALLVVALVGAGVPAWRATRVDPIQALRAE